MNQNKRIKPQIIKKENQNKKTMMKKLEKLKLIKIQMKNIFQLLKQRELQVIFNIKQ